MVIEYTELRMKITLPIVEIYLLLPVLLLGLSLVAVLRMAGLRTQGLLLDLDCVS